MLSGKTIGTAFTIGNSLPVGCLLSVIILLGIAKPSLNSPTHIPIPW